MNTLFDVTEFTAKQPHGLNGKFITKAHKSDIDKLRLCVVSEVNRHDCVANLLRKKDEQIIKLKKEVKRLSTDYYSKLFT